MQALQPVHFFTSTITAPFSALYEAPEGQVSMQGASWQWRHILGKKKRFTSGYSPTSLSSTRLKKTPGGVFLGRLRGRGTALPTIPPPLFFFLSFFFWGFPPLPLGRQGRQ